jgi:hypothetical protein
MCHHWSRSRFPFFRNIPQRFVREKPWNMRFPLSIVREGQASGDFDKNFPPEILERTDFGAKYKILRLSHP